MLKETLRFAVPAAVIGVVLASANPASAEGLGQNDNSDDGSASTSGNTVTVQVSGTMVSGGSAGSSGSTSVSVPSPCGYNQGWNGKRYAEWVDSGDAQREWQQTGGGLGGTGQYEPRDGYKKHKDDAEGHWYGGSCNSGDYEDIYGEGGDLDEFFDFAETWFDNNPAVFVPAGGQPPTPPIPPALLRDAAVGALEIPEPAFEFNPDRGASPDTIVNLPTWFWLTDQTTSGYVTASAGGNSATVNVDMADFSVTADTGDSTGPCGGPGTEWTPAQPADSASDCSIEFHRAAETGLTGESSWTVSWSFNGAPRGELDPVNQTWTTAINVGEVQATVQDVG